MVENSSHLISMYQGKTLKLSERKKPVVDGIFPQFSLNSNSETNFLHCKFLLIKYKPWNNCQQDA